MPKPRLKKSAVKTRLQYIGEQFRDFQRSGDGYKARCPAHDDARPSLSIKEGDDGRVLMFCHAGCPTREVLACVGLSMADLMPSTPYPVATYDFRDESGKPVYQSVRYEPKDFRQRRRVGNGEWVWSLKDVPRVLYQLPGLLASKPDAPVFVVEGEKDADRLTALGLVATTNAGGARSQWLPQYSEALRGRDVVLLPDNDAVGRERVARIASALHSISRSVRIVELPGVPEKGDVSDWLDGGGSKDRLFDLVAQAPSAQRDNETTEPLGTDPTRQRITQRDEPLSRWALGSVGQVEPFPVDVLPGPLRHCVEEVATALPCPADFPGVMLLAVLSAFIGRKRCIAPKVSWIEYPTLWIAIVARSGDRKTPALEVSVAPLRQRQKILYAQYLADVEHYNGLSLEEQGQVERPALRQIISTDATIEALKEVLASNPDGIIYAADELSGWARGMGQYKGGRGDDRQHWLSIWSGTQIVVNRKGRGALIINDPFVSVVGGIQPDALGDVIDVREDGFAARLLFSYPDPIPNTDWTEAVIRGSLQYSGICESLCDLQPRREPLILGLEAKRQWVTWVNAHRKETPPCNLQATWSKFEGYCLRIALVLFLARQVCNETKSARVDSASIDGATALIGYFKSHACRVYASVVDQSGNGRVSNALGWIRRKGGRVTAREVRISGVCGIKDKESAIQLLQDLAELGHGTLSEPGRGSLVFRLNPTVRNGQETNDEETPSA